MRHLTEFEKDIINRIVATLNNGLGNPNYASVIDHLLLNKEVVLDYTNRTVAVNSDILNYHNQTLIEEVQE